MKTSIESLVKNVASEIYDNPTFKNVLEDHLTWLINHPTTTIISVTAHQIEVYDFDWIGLLTELKIHPDLHWLVIRMNGGLSYTDVPTELRSLHIPSYETVQNLVTLNVSTKRIK